MSIEPPEFQSEPPEIEMGGFYICHHDGFDPVTIWVGRVDLPDDLGRGAEQPVVSLIVRNLGESGPILRHGPFWESAGLDCVVGVAAPFDVTDIEFELGYAEWRAAYAMGRADAWNQTPNEVYAQMMTRFLKEVRK